MVDKKYAKAGLGYTIGNILVRGIGFLTIPVFARLMSTSDYGVYNTYTSYEAILFIIMGLALNASFKNANIKFKEKFNSYVSTCVLEAMFVLLIFMVGAIVLFEICGLKKNSYIYILLLHGYASAIISYYNAYLGISYRSKEYVKFALIIAIGNVAISVCLMLTFFTNDRGFARIIGAALPNFLVALYIINRLWKIQKPCLDKSFVLFSLKFSLPLIPHGISQVLLSTFDRIMISDMIGKNETGIYSFSYNIYSIVAVIFSSLNQVYEPWFYEKMHSKDYNSIKNISAKYMYISLMIVTMIMLGAPELIKILGTVEYYDSIKIIVPVTIGGYFSFLYSFPAVVEYYYEKTNYIAFATVISAILNIVLNYIFISQIGYQAAAYTTLVTYLINFIFHYMVSRKLMPEKIYSTKNIIVVILSLIIIGSIIQITLDYFVFRWLLLMLIGVALCRYINKIFDLKKILIDRRRK